MDNKVVRMELLISKLKDKNTIIISDRHEDYLNSVFEYNEADIKELNKFLIFIMTGTPLASRMAPPKIYNGDIDYNKFIYIGRIVLTKYDTKFHFRNCDCGEYFTKFLMGELK